jgi:hypothetical protein
LKTRRINMLRLRPWRFITHNYHSWWWLNDLRLISLEFDVRRDIFLSIVGDISCNNGDLFHCNRAVPSYEIMLKLSFVWIGGQKTRVLVVWIDRIDGRKQVLNPKRDFLSALKLFFCLNIGAELYWEPGGELHVWFFSY